MSQSHKELEEYILSKPAAWLDYPFGEGVAVYKVGSKKTGKMFALITDGSDPANISLKCDPLLAQELRDKYATVMPGYHLNKKLWNTILATGEMEEDYLHSLIDLSYNLVVEGLTKDEKSKLGS
jgi:predicted DNA-binding protein (MmcQ/YjbR family)